MSTTFTGVSPSARCPRCGSGLVAARNQVVDLDTGGGFVFALTGHDCLRCGHSWEAETEATHAAD